MVGVVLVGDHPLVWGRSATWGTGNGAGSFIRKLCFCCGCAEVFGSGKFIRRTNVRDGVRQGAFRLLARCPSRMASARTAGMQPT